MEIPVPTDSPAALLGLSRAELAPKRSPLFFADRSGPPDNQVDGGAVGCGRFRPKTRVEPRVVPWGQGRVAPVN